MAGNERTRPKDEEAQMRQTSIARRRRSKPCPYNAPSDFELGYPTFTSFEERDNYLRQRLRNDPEVEQRVLNRVQEDRDQRNQLIRGLQAERDRIQEEEWAEWQGDWEEDAERHQIQEEERKRKWEEEIRLLEVQWQREWEEEERLIEQEVQLDLERRMKEVRDAGGIWRFEDHFPIPEEDDTDEGSDRNASIMQGILEDDEESEGMDNLDSLEALRSPSPVRVVSRLEDPGLPLPNQNEDGIGEGSNRNASIMEGIQEDDEEFEGMNNINENGEESLGTDNANADDEESKWTTGGSPEDPKYLLCPPASPLFNSVRRQRSLVAWRRRSPHSYPGERSRLDGDPSSSSSEKPPWPPFNPKDRTTWRGIDPQTESVSDSTLPKALSYSAEMRRIRPVLVGENMAHFVPRRGDLLIAHLGTGMPLNSKGYLTTYEGPNSNGFRSQFQRVLLLVRVGQYEEAGPNMFVHKPYRNLQLYRSSFQGVHNNKLKFIYLGHQADMKKPKIPLDNSPGKFLQAGMPVSSAGHLGINPLVPRRGDVIILEGAWLEDFPHPESFRSSLVKWHRDSPIQFKLDDMLLRLFVEKERAPFQWINTGERPEGDRDPPFPGYAELYRFDGPGVGWVFWGRTKHLFDTPYKKGFGLRTIPYVLDDGRDSDGRGDDTRKKKKGRFNEDEDEVGSDESDCRTRGRIGQFS